MKILIYCLGYKAYKAIKELNDNLIKKVDCLIIAKDKNVIDDYSQELVKLAIRKKVQYKFRNSNDDLPHADYHIAIGWRWLIKIRENEQLIVIHDSLLPKYRGFNPLVTSLIQGEKEVGVTALFGTDEYDKGNIICQSSIKISYPIKINAAIGLISDLYGEILNNIVETLISNRNFNPVEQDERIATYSLWRDEEDYYIQWDKEASYIKRFIDSVGFPYKGACCSYKNAMIRILDVTEVPDLYIVNRSPGKLIMKNEGKPIIVCGVGLLKIELAKYDSGEDVVFDNFRIKLK